MEKFSYKNASTGEFLCPLTFTLMPSLSHPHTHTLTLTPSHPHTLTPSHPHTLTLTPSLSLSLTPSHHHTLLEDLWAHLGEASGQPVATVMSTWTQQMGYPVLMVEGRQVRVRG